MGMGLVVAGYRPGNVGGDVDVCARHDLHAAEVTSISDDLEMFGLRCVRAASFLPAGWVHCRRW